MAAKKTKKKKTTPKARKPRQIRVTGGDQAPAAAGAAPTKRGALSKLSVEELQALYKEVVGRETGSSNSSYLIWKIREARNGRIRVGPARTREPRGPQQVLSVRVDEDAVELLDAAWRKHGARSRNDFVLRALGRNDELAHSSIRFTLGRFTRPEDIDFAVKLIKERIGKLREMSPLWEMFKEGIDLNTVQWAAH